MRWQRLRATLVFAVVAVLAACTHSPEPIAEQNTTVTEPVAVTTSAVVTAPQPTVTSAPTTTLSPPPVPTVALPAMRWPVGASMPTTAGVTQPRSRLVVSGVGDTNLDPRYIPALRRHGYDHAFSGLQGVFLDDDLTIVNLECAASKTGRPLVKAFVFNCDVDALPVMTASGVEVANLANNHSLDWGRAALVETIANVENAGMAPVGVGSTSTEAHEAAYFDINGWRIAVLGFGGVLPSWSWLATDDRAGMASGDDIETMVAAVEAAAEKADLVFVTVHWGMEGHLQPVRDDVRRAHAMIDAGADGIFGHHPHRLQPLDFYKGKPIAWSLGNFVWPRLSHAGATTAVAQVIIEPDGALSACLIPTFIETSGHPVIQVDYEGLCTWEGHEATTYRQDSLEPR